MAIKIGINENIFIAGAEYIPATDKLSASVKIILEESGVTKYANAFERMNADEAVESLPTRELIIFSPSNPLDKDGRGNVRTEEQKANLVQGDINSTKAILLHLLTGYMTSKEARLELFEGIDINATNYNSQIIKPPIAQAIFKNMVDQFITKMKPFFGDSTKLFRVLLVRQDAAKPFPTFRKRHIDENPFYEPMEVTKEQSKLMFTPYEIDNGLDNDLPVKKKTADDPSKQGNGGAAPLTAETVFN
jgi:hypothetical protein